MGNVGRPRKNFIETDFERVTMEEQNNDIEEMKKAAAMAENANIPSIIETLEQLKAESETQKEQIESLLQFKCEKGGFETSLAEIKELKENAAQLLAKFEPIKETQTEIEATQKDIETAEEKGQEMVTSCIGLCKTMALQIRNIENNIKDVMEAVTLVHKYSFDIHSMNDRYETAVASATNDLREARANANNYRIAFEEQRRNVDRLLRDVSEMQEALRKRNFI